MLTIRCTEYLNRNPLCQVFLALQIVMAICPVILFIHRYPIIYDVYCVRATMTPSHKKLGKCPERMLSKGKRVVKK